MNHFQEHRLKFLQDSARVVFLAAPSTSRQLLRESKELRNTTSPPVPDRPSDVCAACGNILLPGRGMLSSILTSRTKPGKKNQGGKPEMRRKVLFKRCSVCLRATKTARTVEAPSAKELQHCTKSTDSCVKLATFATTESCSRSPAKSSSKKRAKARKDRDGLQALLRNTMQSKAAPTLTLSDLMKQ